MKSLLVPILAEGAIAVPVTLSGGVLFASWKLFQFLSSLIVKVILAIFMRASAQHAKQVVYAFECDLSLQCGWWANQCAAVAGRRTRGNGLAIFIFFWSCIESCACADGRLLGTFGLDLEIFLVNVGMSSCTLHHEQGCRCTLFYGWGGAKWSQL